VRQVVEGELAALSVARDADETIERAQAKALQTRIRRSAAFARAMHRAHPVPEHWHEWLTEDTAVCRCEEVSYSEICRARGRLDAKDARTVKLLARRGMGWCLGRICGFATAKIAAPWRLPGPDFHRQATTSF
jgi:D-hydroxyproline dehydrogenase subunit alpha